MDNYIGLIYFVIFVLVLVFISKLLYNKYIGYYTKSTLNKIKTLDNHMSEDKEPILMNVSNNMHIYRELRTTNNLLRALIIKLDEQQTQEKSTK